MCVGCLFVVLRSFEAFCGHSYWNASWHHFCYLAVIFGARYQHCLVFEQGCGEKGAPGAPQGGHEIKYMLAIILDAIYNVVAVILSKMLV